MKLTIKNVKSLIGISVRGKWDMESVDEFSHAYVFWFRDTIDTLNPQPLQPIYLNRDAVKQWDSTDKKNIWTYKVMDGGWITADWFTPQNAISIFEGILN